MFSKIFPVAGVALAWSVCIAQGPSPPPQSKPQVKVNMLNVCSPSPADQQEIAAALAKIPQRPSFSPDFEVDRGRSMLDPNANPLAVSAPSTTPAAATATADFVRLRRDFSAGTFSNVQYSFSRDNEQMVETLVFRVRDPKDLLQISIEDSASAVTPVAAMLGSGTPASRIKLERFGKSSVVLARCSGTTESAPPDQGRYEPQFASASAALGAYRGLFGVKSLVPEELGRIPGKRNTAKPAGKSALAPHK